MSTAILTERTAVLYQTMPPLSTDEYARLTRSEEEVIRDSDALLGDEKLIEIAIHNAQWRKAHPSLLHRSDRRKVYFISADRSGLIKIGVAGDPAKRFRQISTMSPERLMLLGTTGGGRAEEAKIHELFAGQRAHGEWFRVTDDLLAFIQGAIA